MKDPAFLFYYQDFAWGTRKMTFEEKGCYIELLCEQADTGHLTIEDIKRILRDSFPIWDAICNKFDKDDNGKFYNSILDEHLFKRRKFTEGRKNNLKGTHKGKHMDKHMENEDIDINEVNNINVLWIRTFGRNPKIPEAEETEKLIEKFGYDKVYQIFKQATLDGFHKIKTLVDALDDQGNIKQKKIIDKYAKPNAVNLHPMNKTTCDSCTKVAVLWSDGFAGCSYEHIIEAKQKRKKQWK